MNEGLIPRRYAKALYKVALEKGDDKTLYDLTNRLVNISAAQPTLKAAVTNPFVSAEDKCNLIKTAVGDACINPTFLDFLKLLVNNKRLDIIFDIAREYAALYRREKNIYKVEVISASPLSVDEQTRLQKLVQSHLGNATMEYSSSVNPELIGGFVVKIDNELLDASVSNELKQLRLNLLK